MEALRARTALTPELASATIIIPHTQQQVGGLSIADLMRTGREHGDLSHAEAALTAQANALNTLSSAPCCNLRSTA